MMLFFLLVFGGEAEDTGPRKRSFHPLRATVIARLTSGTEQVYSVQFSQDGKWLLGSGQDSILRIWSASDFELDREINVESGKVHHAVFSRDAKRILCGSSLGQSVLVYDSDGGGKRNQFSGVVSYFQSADLHPDGKLAAISRPSGSCEVVDLDTGKKTSFSGGPAVYSYALCFSPDGKWLAIGKGRAVRIYDLERGEEFLLLEGHQKFIYALSFSFDSKTLVTGSLDGTARIWDLPSGKERAVLPGHSRYVSSVGMSVDDRWVITTSWDGSVRFWNARTGEFLRKEIAHEGTAWASSFHPDGRRLATGGKDGKILIWGMDRRGEKSP